VTAEVSVPHSLRDFAKAMSLCFRRLYATKIPKPEVTSPFTSRIASAPRNVRLRRLRKEERERNPKGIRLPTPALPPLSLKTAPLTPTEKERYDKLKRTGALLNQEKGFVEPTEEEWLEEEDDRRGRIRGVRKREIKDPETGQTKLVDDVVGVRVYLPNIEFCMVRNYTPPGEAYNPWEATFRVPLSFTKLDIRGYLSAVYGVQCTYIRTQIVLKTMKARKRRTRIRMKNHKRAVVGLVEPFYYPEAMEDMNLQDRTIMQEWLDSQLSHYYTQVELQKLRWQQMQEPYTNGTFKLNNGRGKILKRILERRQAREAAIDETAQAYLPQKETIVETSMETTTSAS